MKKRKDIVDRAVDALGNEAVAPGPPEEAVDAVIEKLAEAGGESRPRTGRETISSIGFTKIAAAAAILIVASYAVGRLTSPRPPDVEQLHRALESSLKVTLEPAIRQELVDEMKKYWQLALAGSYVRLKDELGEQFRGEMNEFAVQILGASGEVTDRRLTELIEAIDAAQTQERRWIATALEQMELNRLQDSSELRNDFVTFAVQTGDELTRTKEDMVQLLSYSHPDGTVPNKPKNLNDSNERSEK